MSIGYFEIQKLRRVEEKCKNLGMRLANPKHRGGDAIAIVPLDESALPVYSRDAELFIGHLDDIESWLAGVEWSTNYYRLLRVTTGKNVQRKEQDFRNRNLIETLKHT